MDFTKTLKALSFAAIVICLALYAWTVWYDRSLRSADPFGYRNLKECPRIPPGAAVADLVRNLGAPEETRDAGGVRRLSFHTLSAAAAPIQAEVEAATGKVVELRCRDDARPTWSLRR